jgi:hypothetical protein
MPSLPAGTDILNEAPREFTKQGEATRPFGRRLGLRPACRPAPRATPPAIARRNFHPRIIETRCLTAAAPRRPGHAVAPGVPSWAMMQPAIRVVPAIAAVLAVGIVVGGCASATATGGAAAARSASSAAVPSAAETSAPMVGPPAPDAACLAARKAEQTLQAQQGKDQGSQSAIDRDFTNFASALNAAARQATHPATARAMTALADDYTALVASQSGAAQLPSVATMQSDGTAFDKACP